MTGDLRVALFGSLRVEYNGHELADSSWHSRQERRLLTFLLLARGASVPADRLIEWLWPTADPLTAATTLRSTISNLRRTLEPTAARASHRYVVTRNAGYAWVPNAAWVDLDAFAELLDNVAGRRQTVPSSTIIEVLEQALALYRGDLLPDEHDLTWLNAERDRLRERYLSAVQQLADVYVANHDYPAALRTVQRGLALDALREPLYRSQMLAQARSGDTAAALQSYERFRQALDLQLGALPSPSTRDLHLAILRGEIAAYQRPLLGSSSVSRATPTLVFQLTEPAPLVGRTAELASLNQWLLSGLNGRATVLTLVGEAGIGKTRLLLATRHMALEQGALPIVLRPNLLEHQVPFAALSDALRPLLRLAPEALLHRLPVAALIQIAELLPVVRERLPNLPQWSAPQAADPQPQTLDGLVDLALALAREQPLVVLCDDAHWLDEATLTVIARLARKGQRHALLLLLAYSPAELPDNPALHALLRSLGRDLRLQPLLLAPLTPAETTQLADQLAPGLNLPGTQLYELTAGNPLFVTVALQQWQIEPGSQTATPDLASAEQIRDLVLLRVARLEPHARDLLEQLAVVGRSVSLDLIEQFAPQSGLEAAQTLLERQLLVEHAEQRVGFAHELVRMTVFQALSTPRRRRLHQAAAEAIEHLHADEPAYAAELVEHYTAAGRGAEAQVLRYATLAGDLARRRFGYQQARTHYTTAIQAGEQLGQQVDASLMRRAFVGLAHTCETLLDLAGIQTAVERYARWVERHGTASFVPLVAPRHLALLQALSGDLAQAAVLSAQFASSAQQSPSLVDALQRTAQILAPDQLPPMLDQCELEPLTINVRPLPEQPTSRLPGLLGAEDAALSLFQIGWATLTQGLLNEAQPCLVMANQLAQDTGQAAIAVMSALQLSHLADLRAEAAAAETWLQRSLDLAAQAPEAAWASIWPQIHQGFSWLFSDQVDLAEQRLSAIERQLATVSGFAAHRTGVTIGLGLVALARQHVAVAEERFSRVLAAPQVVYGFAWAAAFHGLAQIAARRGQFERAIGLLAHVLHGSAQRGLLPEYVRTAIVAARLARDTGLPVDVTALLSHATALARRYELTALVSSAQRSDKAGRG